MTRKKKKRNMEEEKETGEKGQCKRGEARMKKDIRERGK